MYFFLSKCGQTEQAKVGFWKIIISTVKQSSQVPFGGAPQWKSDIGWTGAPPVPKPCKGNITYSSSTVASEFFYWRILGSPFHTPAHHSRQVFVTHSWQLSVTLSSLGEFKQNPQRSSQGNPAYDSGVSASRAEHGEQGKPATRVNWNSLQRSECSVFDAVMSAESVFGVTSAC